MSSLTIFHKKDLEKIVDISKKNIHTFVEDHKVLIKSIDLVQIMRLLKFGFGISNAYIIDPHCSVAYCKDSSWSVNEAFAKNAFHDLRENYSHSGDGYKVVFNPNASIGSSTKVVESSVSQPSPAQKVLTDCVNCDNTTALAAGVTCCLGTTLFLGSPAVGAAPVIQYGLGTAVGFGAKTVTNEIYPVNKGPYGQTMERGVAKKRTNRKKRKRLATRKKRKRSTRKKRN